MKAGLNRNRIGDIIVHKNGAYIFVLNENSEYIVNNLKNFSRFSKATIEIVNYDEVEINGQEFNELQFTVTSLRIDSIVSGLIKTSRSRTNELLKQEKIFLNAKIEKRGTKSIIKNDILAIRGYGKFIISEILGINKRGKTIILAKKYK